jgi:hypothetical protein
VDRDVGFGQQQDPCHTTLRTEDMKARLQHGGTRSKGGLDASGIREVLSLPQIHQQVQAGVARTIALAEIVGCLRLSHCQTWAPRRWVKWHVHFDSSCESCT